MNKLVTVFSALAVAAGIAQGEVKSANIVGYQDFNGTSGFTLTVPTFVPPSTDGSTMTLGDLVANSAFVSGEDAISLYNGGTLYMKVTFYPYDDPDEYGIEGGWYEIKDFEGDAPVNLNNTPIPFGTGFAFSRINDDAAITYKGEVKESPTTLPSTGGFTLCGNVMPKAGTLADVYANAAFVSGEDAISLFNGGTLDKKVTFYPYDDPDEYGIEGGWYEIKDFESDAPINLNATVFSAGQGFAFSRINDDARLIVANPLAEE